jgi:hypothetical protein
MPINRISLAFLSALIAACSTTSTTSVLTPSGPCTDSSFSWIDEVVGDGYPTAEAALEDTLANNPYVAGTPRLRQATDELVIWDLVLATGPYEGSIVGEIHAGFQGRGWIITFTEQCTLSSDQLSYEPTTAAARSLPDDSWPTPDELGSCPYQGTDLQTIDFVILGSYLQLYPVWLEVSSLTTTTDPDSEDFAPGVVSVASFLVGETEPELLVRPNLAALGNEEIVRGAGLLVGVRTGVDSTPYIGPMITLRPNGDAVFIGFCGVRNTSELSQYVDYLASEGVLTTPARAVIDLVTKPEAMVSYEEFHRLQP